MKKDLNINDYAKDLESLCDKNFRCCRKCTDTTKICFLKKRVWQLAKIKYLKQEKNNGGQL